MPFKKRNGEYYIEAVSVSSAITKELEASFIGLCPLCAAKYMEFIRRDEKADKAFLKTIARSAEPKIHLKVGEATASLRFVDAHWHDLQLILQELSLT